MEKGTVLITAAGHPTGPLGASQVQPCPALCSLHSLILICKPAAQLILNLQSLRLFWFCLKANVRFAFGLA